MAIGSEVLGRVWRAHKARAYDVIVYYTPAQPSWLSSLSLTNTSCTIIVPSNRTKNPIACILLELPVRMLNSKLPCAVIRISNCR